MKELKFHKTWKELIVEVHRKKSKMIFYERKKKDSRTSGVQPKVKEYFLEPSHMILAAAATGIEINNRRTMKNVFLS